MTQGANAGKPGEYKEPAVVTYLFGPAYRDLKDVANTAMNAGLNKATEFWARGTGTLPRTNYSYKNVESNINIVTGAFWIAAAACTIIFGIVTLLFLTLLHAMVLAIGTTLLLLSALLIRAMDIAWRFVWRSHFTCYAGTDGYHLNNLPVFLCPNCNKEHRKLVPGRFGVFRRFCECGANLPVIHILGRQHLPCQCAVCSNPIVNIQASDIHIAFVGGPSSGKTNLFFMQLSKMMHTYHTAGFDRFEYAEDIDKKKCEAQIKLLEQGRPAEKTAERTPRALHLVLRPIKRPMEQSLLFYDVAGEAFQNQESVGQHTFYNHLDSVIFVIDPFSIPAVKETYREQLAGHEKEVNPSDLEPQDAYDRMYSTLANYCRTREKGIRGARLAVVISKVDMFDLHSLLDREPQGTLVPQETGSEQALVRRRKETAGERMDRSCREWLANNGQGNLVRNMERDFARVQFFAASALGRSPGQNNTRSFEGMGVLEPLIWSVPRLLWKEASNGR